MYKGLRKVCAVTILVIKYHELTIDFAAKTSLLPVSMSEIVFLIIDAIRS